MNFALRSLFAAFGAVLVPLAACGGTDAPGATVAGSAAARFRAITHEDCGESSASAERFDANNDGKPEVVIVRDGERIKCRAVYLGKTGRVDMYEYLDGSGKLRRRELAYGEKGLINAVEIYEGGKLIRREYDTTGLKRVDTVDYFDGAASASRRTPSRRERDTNADGQIDQWWTWEPGRVRIEIDRDADGKPDDDSRVIMTDTGTGLALASASAPAPAPAAPSASATPLPSKDAGR